MRKLSREQENPIDNHIIDSAESLARCLHKIKGMSPNVITTIGFIFGILSIIFFIKKKYLFSALFFVVNYIFDCADGAYARIYDQVTVFGDYYDHFKDLTVVGIISFLIYKKNTTFGFLILFLFLLTLIHLGNQEEQYDKNESCSLDFTKSMTFFPIDISRYFGCGTFITIITIMIVYFHFL